MTQQTPYQPFPNTFKQALLAGQTLIGCWCSLANPISTEVLGVAGFDWILLDGEGSLGGGRNSVAYGKNK